MPGAQIHIKKFKKRKKSMLSREDVVSHWEGGAWVFLYPHSLWCGGM